MVCPCWLPHPRCGGGSLQSGRPTTGGEAWSVQGAAWLCPCSAAAALLALLGTRRLPRAQCRSPGQDTPGRTFPGSQCSRKRLEAAAGGTWQEGKNLRHDACRGAREAVKAAHLPPTQQRCRSGSCHRRRHLGVQEEGR